MHSRRIKGAGWTKQGPQSRVCPIPWDGLGLITYI